MSMLVSIWSGSVLALPCDKSGAQAQGRPRIGLVLGGGGARGAAHVGVLKVLEEMRIPVDCIAGNSMGAIVGGLYAAGLSPEEIEREMVGMDWDDVLNDQPRRPDQQFRRKRDDDNYLVKKYVGLQDGKIELPLGYIQGQKFDMELARLTHHASGLKSFDDLPVPFRAVATDIETGKAVVLSKGNLARVIRASMAVPGAFDPVEIDGKLLVDGLVANNVPVDVGRAMGADVLIVVNVGTPLMKRAEITTALAVIGQMSNILSARNVEEQLKTLQKQDVYIDPDLGDLSTSDFKRAADAIAVGEKAANEHRDALARLVSREAAQRDQIGERKSALDSKPVIAFVKLDNQSRISDNVLMHPFKPLIGKPLDYKTVRGSVEDLYGWNIFESVRYEVVDEDGKDGLLVHVKEKSWGPNYVQLGIALATDFEGESSWNLGASVLKTALNRYAGEARLAAQIGDSPLAFAEFYQPLDPGLRYFINPVLLYDARSFSRFEGDDEIEEYRVSRYGGGIAAGRVLGHWGEFRVGFRRYTGEAELRVGDPTTPDIDIDSAEAYARLFYDTVDNRNWPHSGGLAQWEWIESIESLGADTDFSQSLLTAGYAHSWGKNTVIAGGRFNYTVDGEAPVQNRFRTGGFYNLSGFTQDQLSGQHDVLLRTTYYRRLGNIEWLPAYAGVSLEYGNVFEDRGDITLAPEDNFLAGSIFLGVDTVLGPVYLGYGHAEQGHDSVYLYLGRLF
jgi:NTE family protein